MHEPFDEETANPTDKVAWILCQVIDDDAPIRWARYRGTAKCLAANQEFINSLVNLSNE